MTKPLETAGDLYVDTYGKVRELRPAECGCCLEGVIACDDGDMAYTLPREAVARLPAGSRNESRKAQAK